MQAADVRKNQEICYPRGMPSFSQRGVVAVIALLFGLGAPWSEPVEIVTVNGFFVALFVASALLFRSAARELTPAGTGPEG